MNRDDIIRMAREAGISKPWDQEPVKWETLERFANLVAAEEREACAALCDKIADDDGFEGGYADYCAVSIRERGAPALERLNKAAEDSGEPL
jgi:hypothetical protein